MLINSGENLKKNSILRKMIIIKKWKPKITSKQTS